MRWNLRNLWIALALVTSLVGNSAYASKPMKEWTILVYINGHNNLDYFGAKNIKQMERVGSSDQVNIVVQWASAAASDTKRLYVTKSTNPNNVTSTVVQSLSPVDMGSAQSLVDFAKWGVENYPAKHYFVDVWNHGNGWHKSVNAGRMQPKDISWDDRFGTFITTKELGQAMTTIAQAIGHKVDVYGSDACMMAMAEVAGEMKDSVQIFTGSQETEPGDGWPYDAFLAPLVANPMMTAEELGNTLSDAYLAAYQGGQFGTQDVTFSSYNLEKWAGFEKAMADFSAQIASLPASELKKVKAAADATQSFYDYDYRDLSDFMARLSSASIQGLRPDVVAALNNSVNSLVVKSVATSYYSGAHGLSIWLPTDRYSYSQYSAKYTNLEFNTATSWGATLNKLVTTN